jgi:hypothetical protein
MHALRERFRPLMLAGLAALALAIPAAASATAFAWCGPQSTDTGNFHYFPAYYEADGGSTFPLYVAVRTYAKMQYVESYMVGDWRVFSPYETIAAQVAIPIPRIMDGSRRTVLWSHYIQVYVHDGYQWNPYMHTAMPLYEVWRYGSTNEGFCSFGP